MQLATCKGLQFTFEWNCIWKLQFLVGRWKKLPTSVVVGLAVCLVLLIICSTRWNICIERGVICMYLHFSVLHNISLNRADPLVLIVDYLKVSAPANSAHFRWYTDIQCKSIIYMLDNNIAFWSIRNKTSEKIVRLHHSKGVILITPWGWHGKRRIQISQKPQQFVGKMKCNTNRDVKSNNPVFDQDTAPRNTPSRGQFVVL